MVGNAVGTFSLFALPFPCPPAFLLAPLPLPLAPSPCHAANSLLILYRGFTTRSVLFETTTIAATIRIYFSPAGVHSPSSSPPILLCPCLLPLFTFTAVSIGVALSSKPLRCRYPRLAPAYVCLVGENRRASSLHCRDARVHGHTTRAMH